MESVLQSDSLMCSLKGNLIIRILMMTFFQTDITVYNTCKQHM